MNELEQNVFAYYIQGAASELDIAGRFYPKSELVFVIADKIQVATRKFGRKVSSKDKAVATTFLEHMIEKGAFTSKQNDFGGTMHQFQTPLYKQELKALQDSDPIVQQAKAGGETFWQDRFTALSG